MAKNKSVCLVTGATSGIGALLVRRLIAQGNEVRIILKEGLSVGDEIRKLPAGVIPFVADLRLHIKGQDRELETACKGADTIFHIAGAVYSHKFTFDELVNINVIGTENLLKAFINANGRDAKTHLIFTSSVSVYGHRGRNETITEESKPRPDSPYAESKLMAEHLVESFHEAHPNISYTIVRMGTLYGRYYEKPSFFKAFRLIKEQKMIFVGSENNHLTLLHEDDAVDAMLLAAQGKDGLNKIYNVTDGINHTEKSLFEIVAHELKVPSPKRRVSVLLAKLGARTQNITSDEFDFLASDRVISIDRIKSDLGFSPKRRIETDGIEMLNDFKKEFYETGKS
ncbi:MAG: NAD(P)-dependent oxidoreductase [Candidatus Micrarchaeota archaeon]|nr:NAD(P)-dependent oxidoreductase [Candidatus Micrarchaeota archaeon]